MIKIGSHMDNKAPDYVLGAVKGTIENGANALMIYTGAPQSTIRKAVSEFKIEEAKELMKEKGIDSSSLVIHAPYIINLANCEKEETFNLGVDFLKQEIVRSEEIGASYLVLHPGSALKTERDLALKRVCEGLNAVIKEDQKIMILLETMAGKGSEVGVNFAELKTIIEGLNYPDKVGICMDTCHLNDAGYNVSDFDNVLNEFEEYLPFEKLKVIHVNDSKNPLGAHKDRHENIGLGYIGFESLYRIIHHERLENVVKILETPYIDDKPPYKDEIEMLLTGNYRKLKEEQ